MLVGALGVPAERKPFRRGVTGGCWIGAEHYTPARNKVNGNSFFFIGYVMRRNSGAIRVLSASALCSAVETGEWDVGGKRRPEICVTANVKRRQPHARRTCRVVQGGPYQHRASTERKCECPVNRSSGAVEDGATAQGPRAKGQGPRAQGPGSRAKGQGLRVQRSRTEHGERSTQNREQARSCSGLVTS